MKNKPDAITAHLTSIIDEDYDFRATEGLVITELGPTPEQGTDENEDQSADRSGGGSEIVNANERRDQNGKVRSLRSGDRHFKLVLISKDYKESIFGTQYTDGFWNAVCDCGAQVKVKTHDIRVNLVRSSGCEKCAESYRKRRDTRNSALGRKPMKLEGMIVGRLTVEMWHKGLGWVCKCATCGGVEVCPTSYQVFRRGTHPCDGTCVPQSE